MIVVKPDLGAMLAGAFPTVPEGSIMTCVSLIGTTVVPYNMFIHATSSRKTWHDPKPVSYTHLMFWPVCLAGR